MAEVIGASLESIDQVADMFGGVRRRRHNIDIYNMYKITGVRDIVDYSRRVPDL